jgi:archaellum biogenesis ATPase FlaH
MAVEHFISVGENPVVLLDGFEYLVSHNDFQSVLALLHDLNENVSIRESILLVPLDPKALSEREFALIKRELQVIEAPKGPRLGPRVEVEYSKVSRKGRGP